MNVTVIFIILFIKIFYRSTPTTQDVQFHYNVTLFTVGNETVFRYFI